MKSKVDRRHVRPPFVLPKCDGARQSRARARQEPWRCRWPSILSRFCVSVCFYLGDEPSVAGCRALTLHARGRSVDGTGRSRVLGVQPAARADVIIRDSMDHLNFSMPQRPQSSNCGQALPALPFTTSEITISLPPPKPLAEHGSACGRRQDAGVPAARGCARGVRVGDHV